jgi:hypothetical protein
VIAAVAVALMLGGMLPEGAVRYRVELGGVPIGRAELAIGCAGASCTVRWESRLRLPAESGGAVARRLVSVAVDREGTYRGGALEVEEGRPMRPAPPRGAAGLVPATAAEVLLAAGARGCLEAFEEGSGARGRACAASERGPSGALRLEVLGDVLEVRGAPGMLPREVAIPAQGVRFVADSGARVPTAPPAIAGTEVPGPRSPEGALRFCGLEADAAPPPVPAEAPRAAADGASCREKTAAWLAAARRAGLEGRTAVGVAWDGAAFVWHAWAEVREGARWVPVDPSFEQRPARGPRFTVARFSDGEEAARLDAGRRVLGCWGRARVERGP